MRYFTKPGAIEAAESEDAVKRILARGFIEVTRGAYMLLWQMKDRRAAPPLREKEFGS